MSAFVTLRQFSDHELIFDEDETKVILKFFFSSSQEKIDGLAVTSSVRAFAQGLLVEATDATYALLHVKHLLTTYYFPGAGIRKVLAKLVSKAARHWFKHIKDRSLMNPKISFAVRNELARRFASDLRLYIEQIAKDKPHQKMHMAHVMYDRLSKQDCLWG